MKESCRILFFIVITAVFLTFAVLSADVLEAYARKPYMSGKPTLSAPQNLTWYGSCAKWDPVTNASGYWIVLYHKTGALAKEDSTVSPSYDFRNIFKQLTSQAEYYFTVYSVDTSEIFNNSTISRGPAKTVTLNEIENIVSLNIGVYGGGGTESSRLSINGADASSVSSGITDSYFKGTKITVEYIPKSGSKFLLWLDNKTDRILSMNRTYSFLLGNDTNISAYVIKDNDGTTLSHFCGFRTLNSRKFKMQGYSHGSRLTPPQKSQLGEYKGYDFVIWDDDSLIATQDRIINAVYSKEPVLYDFRVIYQGTAEPVIKQKCPFDDKVTINLDSSLIPQGKYFAGWSLDGGRSVASYEETIELYIGTDTVLTAVFANSQPLAGPCITISPAGSASGSVAFISTRSIPAGYNYVYSGIIYTSNAILAENLLPTSVDNSTVKLSYSVNAKASSQFMLTVNTASGNRVYARAYLIYTDSSGVALTAFSDTVSLSAS